MQIDFHHAVTYVVARLAGYGPSRASIIAHSAQHVDDATVDGTISFTNNAMYSSLASAHKGLDYANFDELANHLVWIPFHFLPGNDGKPAGHRPAGHKPASFVHKLVCRPNSPVAKDLIREAFEDRDKPYGLHRLGVTMHVFADTWAHRGFAGITHKINNVCDVLDSNDDVDEPFHDRVQDFFGDIVDKVTTCFIDEVLPLGHGPALSNPDKPYLKWSYTNGLGDRVMRDNPTDFLEAADQMCMVMQRFLKKDLDAEVPGLPPGPKATIDKMLRTLDDPKGKNRHDEWLAAIARGELGFPATEIGYIDEGTNSWEDQAFGKQDKCGKFNYAPSFLYSDWKKFHDALSAHRFSVIRSILPKYGICAA